ncbi:MAG TPA: glycosyltransferase family 2 protein [Acidimicrobiales bacterium]|nr:glycosyltransferase family 2 protein [Acidimicrobiales bacterium]
MNTDTCVIIPVFNEATVIGDVLRDLQKDFANIVCVDDGSHDDSAVVIREVGVTLIEQPENRGQGAALRTGIEAALEHPDIDYFVTFDADGQHRREDAVRMLEHLRANEVDVVLGSRFLGSAAEGIPLSKRMVLRAAVLFSRLTTGLHLSDTHNGLRVFNRAVAKEMRLECAGMAHASEIIYRIAENRFRYAELPVTITYTAYSIEKGQSVLHGFRILRELVRYRMGRSK